MNRPDLPPAQEMLLALEAHLDVLLPADSPGPARLREAERYMLLLPAKRVRALLAMRVTAAWGADWHAALTPASAIEMVHAASLIVDDLPCVDDARLRRGAEPSHGKFGEATSILSAFGLMNHAFAVIAECADLDAKRQVEAIRTLTSAIGPLGLTGGEEEDLHADATELEAIEQIHKAKTGSLFAAATDLGSIVAGISGPRRIFMADCGSLLGQAFQILDDVLDFCSAADATGKASDRKPQTGNVAAILDREAALAHADRKIELALECLEASGANSAMILPLIEEIVAGMRAKLV